VNDHEPRSLHGLARHYLGDLVYGANDGIITTFPVVAGVAEAALPVRTILILGFANLFARDGHVLRLRDRRCDSTGGLSVPGDG
jgi:hypothetical protein